MLAHQEVFQWNGNHEFEKHVESFVQSVVSVESEHSKVNIVTTQRSLEHVETNRDALEREKTWLRITHTQKEYARLNFFLSLVVTQCS